jgi:hypothetical protein
MGPFAARVADLTTVDVAAGVDGADGEALLVGLFKPALPEPLLQAAVMTTIRKRAAVGSRRVICQK